MRLTIMKQRPAAGGTLVAISGPIVTVAMGFLVGFVALALFMPLVALIDSASGAFG
jgi:type II secretory pathway component PulF